MARHDKGEALAQIAADYGCSAPAISYILKRAREITGVAVMPPAVHEDKEDGLTEDSSNGAETADMDAKDSAWKKRAARVEASDTAELRPAALRADNDARSIWFTHETQHEISHHVASFVVALDCLLGEQSVENIELMMTASERLMQVAARTRIEAARMREEASSLHERPHSGKLRRRI
jgi:hypothetical protein